MSFLHSSYNYTCTIEPNLIQHTWSFDVLTGVSMKMWEVGFCEPLIPIY